MIKRGQVKNANQKMRRFAQAFGPAWIAMIAYVDVAFIITGPQSGATWGYRMIFVLIPPILPYS